MLSVRESEASSLAALAAILHFLYSMGWEHTLGRFGLISSSRLQKITEIAYLGLVLKLANDIGDGLGLEFWGTIFGELCNTFVVLHHIA